MNYNTEIKKLLDTQNITKREVSKDLEDMLYKPMSVLDHGFIRVIDYMGNDSSIVQAARVSYGRGTKTTSQDKGLIYYLMKHRHTTPFEMCDIKFHIKLPIFIARQWIRHRTASVNEYSARYSILSNEFYIPEKINLTSQSTMNKQGRSDDKLSDDVVNKVLKIIKEDSEQCYKHYIEMMNEDDQGDILDKNAIGITRELARINLTLNHYTEWYWKINLHNLLHFLALRVDIHAQYEIRVYAQAMLDIVKAWVPYTYEAFVEYILEGVNLSKQGIGTIKQMINGHPVSQHSSGMNKREWSELMRLLNCGQRTK